MPLFRFHRGQLDDSLKTTVIVKNMTDLMTVIKQSYDMFKGEKNNNFGIITGFYPDEHNCFDKRCGWFTQLVTCDILERGIFLPEGFLSEPL
jgi:hypothetical protein